MQKFRFSDHVRYNRHDPGEPQAIYFDIAPDFHQRLEILIDAVDQQLDADGVVEIGEGLNRYTAAVESYFGQLTLPELLYVAHDISARMAFRTGCEVGYKDGCDDTLRAYTGLPSSSKSKRANA